MSRTDNMKQAMYEMFGVGQGAENPDAAPAEKEKTTTAKPTASVVHHASVVPTKMPDTPAASFLAAGTAFEGTLNAKGDVEIAGDFKGNISTEGAVRLHSDIQSSITAKSVELLGCVLTGDLKVSGGVTISANSKVIGNVKARELLCAGAVDGDLKVSESVRLDSSARICGNIATGTISVEKGAVISGNVQICANSEAKQ